jgi:preprotein translocase subunit SecD
VRRALAAACVALLLLAGCHHGSTSTGTTTTSTASTTVGPKAPVVELRAIANDTPNDCGALPDNPPTDKPVAVLYRNQCVSLDAGGLAVSRGAVDLLSAQSGALVQLTLSGPDVAALADFSKSHVGRQVAVVAFAKILSVVTVQEPLTDGRLTMSGVTPSDAARLRAALA